MNKKIWRLFILVVTTTLFAICFTATAFAQEEDPVVIQYYDGTDWVGVSGNILWTGSSSATEFTVQVRAHWNNPNNEWVSIQMVGFGPSSSIVNFTPTNFTLYNPGTLDQLIDVTVQVTGVIAGTHTVHVEPNKTAQGSGGNVVGTPGNFKFTIGTVNTFGISFDQVGVGSDFTGTILAVDTDNYGVSGLAHTYTWDENSSHFFNYDSPLNVDAGKRYVWDYADGLSTAQSDTVFIATEDGTITAYYKTQYYLTMACTPAGLTVPTGEGWYDDGAYADISITSPIVSAPYTYFFAGWTTADMTEITDPWVLTTTVYMDKAKTVTANYQAMIRSTTAKSKGFWTNNNGQPLLVLSDAVYLNTLPPYMTYTPYPKEPTGSTPFNTTNLNNFKKQVKDYLNNANATDMRYMLAAQLLAVELDVRHNFLTASQEVWLDNGNGIYEPGENYTITAIMSNAITAWQSGTLASRTYWKDVCDQICNNLLWFIVSGSPSVTPPNTNPTVNSGINTSVITPSVHVAPNPVSSFSMINYTVGMSGRVSLKLYNATGRIVETMVNGTVNAGSYTTTISTQNLAKGIYFLKFTTENYERNLKVVVQ